MFGCDPSDPSGRSGFRGSAGHGRCGSSSVAGMATEQETSAAAPAAPTSAAIFDLDRTLLSGASGPIIGEALRHVGLLTTPSSTLESLAFGVFNLIGETWPSMLVTRQGARAARGWSVDLVRAAAERAAEPLAEAVLPYAQQMIAEHRAQGRLLVMATTTPEDLIRPLAEALGLRRGDRHPLRASRRALRRHDRRRVRVGQGQGPVGRRVGVPPGDRPGRQLRLQRQLLRRAPAVDRRAPAGRSTPIRG